MTSVLPTLEVLCHSKIHNQKDRVGNTASEFFREDIIGITELKSYNTMEQ